jgi:hypothetical protein
MSTAPSRGLMRLLAAAFLLLLTSDTSGRARIPVHRHHSSHPVVAAANHGALLAAAAPEWKHVDTARPQLLAAEATLLVRRVEPAPAPARDSVSLRSYKRTTSQDARPPPFQA